MDANQLLTDLRAAMDEWDTTTPRTEQHELAAARTVALAQMLDHELSHGTPVPDVWARRP